MRNRTKCITGLILALFFHLHCINLVFAAVESSCMTCHTNESLMKSLHNPPPAPMGEAGEG